MAKIIKWIKAHPGWSWLIGIIIVPTAFFGIGYSLAFWVDDRFPSLYEPVLDVTQFLVFISPVVITYWSMKQRKKNREQS